MRTDRAQSKHARTRVYAVSVSAVRAAGEQCAQSTWREENAESAGDGECAAWQAEWRGPVRRAKEYRYARVMSMAYEC